MSGMTVCTSRIGVLDMGDRVRTRAGQPELVLYQVG